jgi:hypothetical protein
VFLLRSWRVLVKKSLHLRAPKGLLQHSICPPPVPYPEPHQFNPLFPTLLVEDPFYCYPPHLHQDLPSGVFPSGLPIKTLYAPLLPPMCTNVTTTMVTHYDDILCIICFCVQSVKKEKSVSVCRETNGPGCKYSNASHVLLYEHLWFLLVSPTLIPFPLPSFFSCTLRHRHHQILTMTSSSVFWAQYEKVQHFLNVLLYVLKKISVMK